MARMDEDDLIELAPGALLRGTSYRVTKKLGAGGMGAVYAGEHVRLKRRVCFKVIHPGLRGRDDFLQRMEREAQTLARLDHPGIVRVFDLGVTDDGIPYFVMELLEGKDLRKLLLSRRFFALPDALAIMKDVLEALAHAHTEGIVHRDIKPENVFLALSGADAITKVLDFGIAHVTDDPRGLTGQRFLGTCQYAAPEQLQGQKPTERTDIYAAGCMLFELIAGRRPFPGPKAQDFIRQHLQDAPPLLSSFVPVPQALDELVASALSKDPTRRPISALWFAAQLHQLSQLAEDVVLASANTTEEMLLTAVTAGVESAPQGAGARVNDTVRDAALPLGIDPTTPQNASPIGRPKVNTVPLAAATAPLDMRLAGTRDAPAVPRLRTEELTDDEHDDLEGRPKDERRVRSEDVSAVRGLSSAPTPPVASTGGALSVAVASNAGRRRAEGRWRALIIASPVIGGLLIAGAILAVGWKRDDRVLGSGAPAVVVTSATSTGSPSASTASPSAGAVAGSSPSEQPVLPAESASGVGGSASHEGAPGPRQRGRGAPSTGGSRGLNAPTAPASPTAPSAVGSSLLPAPPVAAPPATTTAPDRIDLMRTM